MVAYGFTEGEDYLPVSGEVAREGRGTVIRIDHAVTFDMAKELGMLQRTEKGKRIRQYFIAIEKNGALTEDQIYSSTRLYRSRIGRSRHLRPRSPRTRRRSTTTTRSSPTTTRCSSGTAASDLDMTEKALRELLVAEGWIYKEETTRWSEKRQEKVKITRWSEYSHKKPYFYRRLDHDAPRFREKSCGRSRSPHPARRRSPASSRTWRLRHDPPVQVRHRQRTEVHRHGGMVTIRRRDVGRRQKPFFLPDENKVFRSRSSAKERVDIAERWGFEAVVLECEPQWIESRRSRPPPQGITSISGAPKHSAGSPLHPVRERAVLTTYYAFDWWGLRPRRIRHQARDHLHSLPRT